MKKYFIIFFTLFLAIPVFAFEDCLVMTNGKLNNIKIQNNDIIDVFPLITVMNDKNTLIVHPLKEGTTKFSVTKNDKDNYIFSVKVSKDTTTVETSKEGFDILNIDCPPNSYRYYFDIDEPPIYANDNYLINDIDEPPLLRKGY